MGSPYLNSGEAIILTTNRVSADAVMYDVMLTSERIFLIDNLNARFEPRIIPLTTILSVQGGKTTAHDPVITLLFRSGEVGDARQPLHLVFSQNPSENRKPERDDWMRSLIQLSISQHEREAVTETPVIPEVTGETGLRPSVRHGVAPEMVRPFSNVVDHWTKPAPFAIIPDEVEVDGKIPIRTAILTPVKEERPAPEPGPEESATDITPVRGSPPRRTDPPARVIIPKIIEELLSAPAGAAPPVEQEPTPLEDTGAQGYSIQTAAQLLMVTEKPAPEPLRVPEPVMTPVVLLVKTGPEQTADITPVRGSPPRRPDPPARVIIPKIIEELLSAPAGAAPPVEQEPAPLEDTGDTGAQGYSIQTGVQLLMVTEKPAPEPLRVPEPVMTPIVPVVETGPEQTAAIPPPAAAEPREVAEILRALHAGAAEPVTTEQSDTATSGTVPEPVPESPKADIHGIPEPHITLAIPENVVQDSVGHPAPEAVIGQETAAVEDLPVRHPIPPAREIHPFRITLAHAAMLLLVIAIIAAVAVLLLPQGPGQTTSPPITPTTGIVPGTTSPPPTVQSTTVPHVTTRITTTSPPPSLPVSVPQADVWVRVNSTSNYTGRVGNAGFMQPFSGSGNNFYKVRWSDRPVQVSVQKLDNSGALLAVGIYRNGTLISTSSVTSPMGTVDMLIDPLTARPPGLTTSDGPVPITTPFRLENY